MKASRSSSASAMEADAELAQLEREEIALMVRYATSRDHWQCLLDYFGDKRPVTVWRPWLTPMDAHQRSVLRWWLLLLLLICLGVWLGGLF